MNPQQNRQRDMMGAAWQKKKKEQLAKEREEFNRQQAEAEAREAAARQAQQTQGQQPPYGGQPPGQQKPFGSSAWQSDATLPAVAASSPAPGPTSARVPTVHTTKAKPGGIRRLLGIFFLLVAIGFGVLALAAGYEWLANDAGGSAMQAAFIFVLIFVFSLGLRKQVLGGSARGRSRGAGLTGEARGVQRRMEAAGKGNVEILTFRVERYDSAGNRLTPVSVQMRGASYEGSLQDGDQVRLPGKWQAGQNLKAKVVYNLTTNSTVKARGPKRAGSIVANIFFFLVVIGLLALFFAAMNSVGSGWF